MELTTIITVIEAQLKALAFIFEIDRRHPNYRIASEKLQLLKIMVQPQQRDAKNAKDGS